MANTILTPTVIAKEAIAEMMGNTIAPDVVHTSYSSEYRNVGDTISIRKPTTFTAEEFTGSAPTTQNAVETSVSVTLDKLITTDFAVTSKELSLSIPDFTAQFVNPAVNSLIAKIESDILEVGKKASWAVSATGAVTDFTNSSQLLSDNKVPMMNRFALFSPALLNSYQQLAVFNQANTSNEDTQRTGRLGNKFGFETFMSQYLYNYTTSASGTIVAVGSTAAGSSTLTVSGVTNDLVPGDSVKVGNYFYHIDSATAKSGTTQTLTLGINTQAEINPGTSVTVVGAHKVNLFGHKQWATLVTAPLMPYIGGTESAVMNYKGMSIRVSYAADLATKSNKVSFDVLYGIKILDPKKIVKGMAF